MITLSASQDFTAGKLAVALAYAIGSGVVLYVLMLGGRRLVDRIKPARGRVQAAHRRRDGPAALAMAADLDIKFQNAIATELPVVPRQPDRRAWRSPTPSPTTLAARPRRRPRRPRRAAAAPRPQAGRSTCPTRPGSRLHRPRRVLQHRRRAALDRRADHGEGQVVLIDFWTYTCINCIRTLPYLKALGRASTATRGW